LDSVVIELYVSECMQSVDQTLTLGCH